VCALCNNKEETISPFFSVSVQKTQTIWYNLSEFLIFKHYTRKKTRLEALLCFIIGSHCYNILKYINKLKEKIYIFNETQQTKYLFYHFSQL